MNEPLLVQIVGVAAALFTLYAIQARTTTQMRVALLAGNLCWMIHHLGMGSPGASLGAVVIAIASVREYRAQSMRWALISAGFLSGLASPGFLALWASLGTGCTAIAASIPKPRTARHGLGVANLSFLAHGIMLSSWGSIAISVIGIGVYVWAVYRDHRMLAQDPSAANGPEEAGSGVGLSTPESLTPGHTRA